MAGGYQIVANGAVLNINAGTAANGYVQPYSTPSDQTGVPYTYSYGQPVTITGGLGSQLSASSLSVVWASDKVSLDTGNALFADQAVMSKLDQVIALLTTLTLQLSDGFSLTTDYSAVSGDLA